MPAEAPSAANPRGYLTITLKKDALDKVERVVSKTMSSKNALIVGVLSVMTEEELEQKYQLAVELGLVQAKFRPSPEQRDLLNRINKLSPAQIRELMSLAESLDPS